PSVQQARRPPNGSMATNAVHFDDTRGVSSENFADTGRTVTLGSTGTAGSTGGQFGLQGQQGTQGGGGFGGQQGFGGDASSTIKREVANNQPSSPTIMGEQIQFPKAMQEGRGEPRQAVAQAPQPPAPPAEAGEAAA